MRSRILLDHPVALTQNTFIFHTESLLSSGSLRQHRLSVAVTKNGARYWNRDDKGHSHKVLGRVYGANINGATVLR